MHGYDLDGIGNCIKDRIVVAKLLLSLGVRKLKALEITQSERFQGPFFVHLFQIS